MGEIDYRILTITNPSTLQCEPQQIEIYNERRIWEKAMCVVKDDLFAKKTFYNRLMGIRRNANMVRNESLIFKQSPLSNQLILFADLGQIQSNY